MSATAHLLALATRAAPPLNDALPSVEQLLARAQALLDPVLLWPRWAAFALLGFAAALTLLGRHGQRLLAGSTLALAVVVCSLVLVRPMFPGQPWPGLLAVVGGGVALAFGLALPGATTALASAVVFGVAGAWAAAQLAQLPWLGGALIFGLLGLCLGLANHLFWGLWIPPLASAIALSLACARLLGVRGAALAVPQLAQSRWTLSLMAVLAIALIAISLEREHLRRSRQSAKQQARADLDLKEKLARQRQQFEKHLGNS